MPNKRFMLATLMLAVTTCVLPTQNAFAIGGKVLDQTGCACCPVCDHVCKLDAEAIEEEKTCFEVETKVVCIPRVVFPWQTAKKAACASCNACDGRGCTACIHNGARVRKVCVLKSETYKCPACKYTWSAEKRANGNACDPRCAGGLVCDGGLLCDVGCDSEGAVALPTTAPVALPAASAADQPGLPSDVPPVPVPMPPSPVFK